MTFSLGSFDNIERDSERGIQDRFIPSRSSFQDLNIINSNNENFNGKAHYTTEN